MFKKLSLTLIAVLIALLAAELLVRLVGAAPKIYAIRKGRFQLSHNPRIGYEPAPLAYSGEDLSFYDYRGSSNHLGYRDRDHAVAKPPGVYRIVVVGDSIAAGLRIDRTEDIFPVVLERLLHARGLNAEVINLSVSGYNTQQEVETLRDRGLAYQPDLVLLAYTLSSREHIDGDILKTLLDAERAQGGVSGARVNSWLVNSALYRLVRYRVLRAPPPSPADAQRYLDVVSTDSVAPYFDVLEKLAHEHHFAVMVAVFPRFVSTFRDYKFGEQHHFVADLTHRHGFLLHDLTYDYALCRNQGGEPIEVDNFHPSVYGHRCAAEALAWAIVASHRS